MLCYVCNIPVGAMSKIGHSALFLFNLKLNTKKNIMKSTLMCTMYTVQYSKVQTTLNNRKLQLTKLFPLTDTNFLLRKRGKGKKNSSPEIEFGVKHNNLHKKFFFLLLIYSFFSICLSHCDWIHCCHCFKLTYHLF